MVALARADLLAAAAKADLLDVEDSDAWRRRARAFLDDRDRVREVVRSVPGLNLSATAGAAFVDLLIQARVREENEPLRRMTASAAARFDVLSVRFESRETRDRGAGECSATTARGTSCRNSAKYSGLCFAHAQKCAFFEMDAERPLELKRCGRIALAGEFCRLHEHRRDEVEEERKAEEDMQRDIERAVTNDENSFLHRSSDPVARAVPSQPQTGAAKCKGTTQGNTPCRRAPERGMEYCHLHKNQEQKKNEERKPESDAPQSENNADEADHSATSGARSTDNHRCQGKRRYDGEKCLLRPQEGSNYCRHHQDQDPKFETHQLLHTFEKYVETRDVAEQTEMLEEVLDVVDEYAVATYTLLKSSNQRSAKISSMLGFRRPKTRQVDLTIYPSTLIFQYPDEQDHEEDKVLDTYALAQITSIVILPGTDSTGTRTMRMRFRGKGARNKDFVNISLDTAEEIKQVIGHLKATRVTEARQFIETKYEGQPPYRRWLDQAKEAAAADPSFTVYGILYGRNGQEDNELHEGFFEEKNENGAVVYWWGSSRNKRTGRKIGDEAAKQQFLKELKDIVDVSHSRYAMEDSAYEQLESDKLEEEEIASGDVEFRQSQDSTAAEQKDFIAHGWLKALVMGCERKAREAGDPETESDRYTREFIRLVRDGLNLNGKARESDLKSKRLFVPLVQYQSPPGFFWWDANCDKQPIGGLDKLKEFSIELDGLFRKNFTPLNPDSKNISADIKAQTWEQRRSNRPPLATAFAKAFGVHESLVPAEVNDSQGKGLKGDNTFRVDMYGNVIAVRKGGIEEEVNKYRVCAIEYDHVLPYSRGGRTDWANIEPICLMANQRKKEKLLHGSEYFSGWYAGENRLDCGMTVEQFVSMWVHMSERIHDRSGNPLSLMALISNSRGKDVIEWCFRSPSFGEQGWTALSAVLCGNHPYLDPRHRNQPRPMGEQLFKILQLYANTFTLDDFLRSSKNLVYPHLPDARVVRRE